MKTKLLFLASVALILGACNNKAVNDEARSTADTSSADIRANEKSPTASATASDKTAASVMSDTAFLLTAYNTGVFEIKASKLAKRMTEHKPVKEFANMIIKDHEAMDSNVVNMLKERGCAIPTDLPENLKAKMKELNEYMGKDFDQRYAQANIDGHKDAIGLFTDVSKNSKDAAIRKLADDALPVLQKHENDADSLMVFINTPRKW